jgi:hypothetical protein
VWGRRVLRASDRGVEVIGRRRSGRQGHQALRSGDRGAVGSGGGEEVSCGDGWHASVTDEQ